MHSPDVGAGDDDDVPVPKLKKFAPTNPSSVGPRTHHQWALQSISRTTGGGQNVSK